MIPNQLNGSFQIRVTASYQGRQASTSIRQSNEAGGGGSGSNAAHTGISGKTIGIIAAVAAAGAVGAALGLRGSSGSTTTTGGQTTITGTISLGSGVQVGPPH
jgi:hypothetical protein